jgi:hypothetical protein
MTALPQDISVTKSSSRDQLMAGLQAGMEALKPAARQAGRQIAKAAEPVAAHVRKRPVAYTVGALLVGAGIGLLVSRKARAAVGDTLVRGWDLASDRGGEAADSLRELLRR